MPKDLDKITIKRGKRGDFSPTQSDHYHNHYEICYLNSGKCRFLLQDSVYQLEKGDLDFYYPRRFTSCHLYLQSHLRNYYDMLPQGGH